MEDSNMQVNDAATQESIRVLIADDHMMLREGLKRLLGAQAGIDVCGEAEEGRVAVDRVRELRPDVVLMDLAMPNLNGLDATKRILKARPKTRVLVFSMYFDDEYLRQAIDAGVAGYVLKDAPSEEVAQAVRVVATGQRYFSPGIPRDRLDKVLKAGRTKPVRGRGLTHREREVMKLLAEGSTVKQVAELLGLSQKTVDTHKTNLMKKLGIHNRVELVRWSVENKLIQL
jgi:DNA-binding NarL/FixJ family response regulator